MWFLQGHVARVNPPRHFTLLFAYQTIITDLLLHTAPSSVTGSWCLGVLTCKFPVTQLARVELPYVCV